MMRLLVQCPDRPGIVSRVASFFNQRDLNITDMDQHSSEVENGIFFMRLEFQADLKELDLIKADFEKQVAQDFNMTWRINSSEQKKRMIPLVSKHEHALMEVLWRWSSGSLDVEIPMVISNHKDLKKKVEGFGIPFYHVEVDKNDKSKAENEILKLTEGKADFLVLARYMQILSEDFLDKCPVRIINIHHSFLPAFIGANPYKQAYQKGVKLIGATAHYVTKDLDMGPIIEQDVARVTHRHSSENLKEMGKDVEKLVFARAIRYHIEDRIIVHGNKTIVFS